MKGIHEGYMEPLGITQDDINDAVRRFTQWLFTLRVKSKFTTQIFDELQHDTTFLKAVSVILSITFAGESDIFRRALLTMHTDSVGMLTKLADDIKSGDVPNHDPDGADAVLSVIQTICRESDENSIK